MDSFDVICVLVSVLSTLFSLKCVSDMRKFNIIYDDITKIHSYLRRLNFNDDVLVKHYLEDDDKYVPSEK